MKQFEHYLNKVRTRVNESETLAPSKLRSVTVEYGDGTKISTSMAAHLTDDEIRDFFKIGKVFNLGNAHIPGDGNYGDNMQPVKNVVINESVNEGLNKSDLVNILEKYTTWLVKGDKLKVANVSDLVNQFMGINESVNEHYNVMVVEVPPVDQWYDVQVSSIIGDTAKAFDYMDKRYYIRAKDIDMFTANVGKSVKFKYDNESHPKFMEFAKPVNTHPDITAENEAVINESQCYYCDTCGDRAEHEEIDENPSMKCSNCGSSEWIPENEYESRD
jgi:Zn finger protein HypA/HybF involved in hydrogenase expression